MTSKQRMLIAMQNGQPDMVPVAPDMSNMIPCKLTGKPFWDIYLYQDPPLWKAFIDAVRHFGFDGWMWNVTPGSIFVGEPRDEEVIVARTDDRIITRRYTIEDGSEKWSSFVKVYYRDNPPTQLAASKLGLEKPPEKYEAIEGRKELKKDIALLREAKDYMGDDGVVCVAVGMPSLGSPEAIYDYYDRYDAVKQASLRHEESIIGRLKKLLSAPVKPDVILTGGSGALVFNTPAILRDLALPCLKKVTKMCKDAGIPSLIHCCGPERALVEMAANETDLSCINPLEVPPMGDCDLAEIRESLGHKLALMGNLHTTEVMLMGSVRDVEEASKKAIDDAAEGGGFILSTGDHCGRDTPEENVFKMIDVARTYGKY